MLSLFVGALTLNLSPKWIMEAEKKHGRIAMLALPTLGAISMANHGVDPVPWLNHQPPVTQISFYSGAGVLESLNLRRFDKGFVLKKGQTPGNLLNMSYSPGLDVIEDISGRAAMIGATALLLESLLSK